MKSLSTFLVALVVLLTASCTNPFLSDAYLIDADGVRLDVELVLPEGGGDVKAAVVFAGGSSAIDFRDYTPGFRETLIEDVFLPRDVAVLYVNKRGLGDSTGNWRWSSIEERADDILAAVAHLRTLPNIDPNRIGLIGHSQGGWVVQHAGSLDPTLAFVISLSGPTVSVREQDLEREENRLRCEGLSEEDITIALAKLDQRHERIISTGRWFPFFELRYASNIYQYDPRAAIASLTVPTLFAFGEHDSLVPPASNYERFNEIFDATGAPEHITLHTATSADHGFHVVESMCVTYEEALEDPYSADFAEYLGSWVDELGL